MNAMLPQQGDVTLGTKFVELFGYQSGSVVGQLTVVNSTEGSYTIMAADSYGPAFVVGSFSIDSTPLYSSRQILVPVDGFCVYYNNSGEYKMESVVSNGTLQGLTWAVLFL